MYVIYSFVDCYWGLFRRKRKVSTENHCTSFIVFYINFSILNFHTMVKDSKNLIKQFSGSIRKWCMPMWTSWTLQKWTLCLPFEDFWRDLDCQGRPRKLTDLWRSLLLVTVSATPSKLSFIFVRCERMKQNSKYIFHTPKFTLSFDKNLSRNICKKGDRSL